MSTYLNSVNMGCDLILANTITPQAQHNFTNMISDCRKHVMTHVVVVASL